MTNDEGWNYNFLIQNIVTQQYDIMPITEYQSNLIRDIDNYYKAASYGALFNSEEGILDGILNPQVVKTSETTTINPITPELKNALCNMYESDPYAQSMLEIINLYTFDGDITAELYPTNAHKFKSREEIEKEIFEYVKKDETEDFNDFISIVDDSTRIWEYVPVANIGRKVYGIAGIWKLLHDKRIKDKEMNIDFPVGVPLKLVNLDSYYFGQAYINPVTHHITHYKYEDPYMRLVEPEKPYETPESKKKPIPNVNYKLIREFSPVEPTTAKEEIKLPVSQMIVFLNTNNQITPNSYGYGSSDLLPLLSISSNTRRINEKILPNINETQYLGVGIIKIKSNSNVDMQKLKERINQAGGRFATNADIEYIEITNKFDMAGTLEQRQLNIRNMLMKFQIPSPLFNFEEIANKATIDTVVTYLIKVITKERKYIENTLYRQWYQPLMALYFPKKKYLNLRLKVKLNFPPIDFTSLEQKVGAWLKTYQADITTKPETRINIGIEPFAAQEDLEQDNQTNFEQNQLIKGVMKNQQRSFLAQQAQEGLKGAEFNTGEKIPPKNQSE
ncbi:MAG: hypothetical protein R2685_10795 [Candidatus Nitrosocosmicus sp.]|nr:phage portal protein [Candidatus Nitrosocosmicus sp.]